MALVKKKDLPNGTSGEYWRIIEHHNSEGRKENAVVLQLYVDQQARIDDLQPLNDSARFIFRDGDYPLSDFDPDRVDTADVDDFRDLELHVRYMHIKDVATKAQAIVDAFVPTETETEPQLTSNESAALWFVDAVDVL